jgi:hypothetical protein
MNSVSDTTAVHAISRAVNDRVGSEPPEGIVQSSAMRAARAPTRGDRAIPHPSL